MVEKLSRRNFLRLASNLPSVILPKTFFSLIENYQIETSVQQDILFKDRRNGWGPEILTGVETDNPYFGLTIDDGWGPDTFERMLTILKTRNYRATFFLVGQAVQFCEYTIPGILSRFAEDGHHLAYHTMSHDIDELRVATASELSQDFNEWCETLEYLFGTENFSRVFRRYARAPGGEFNLAFLEMCRNKSLQPVGWYDDSSTLNRGVPIRRGHILLLHVRETDIEFIENIGNFTDGEIIPVTLDCLIQKNNCVSDVIGLKADQEVKEGAEVYKVQ